MASVHRLIAPWSAARSPVRPTDAFMVLPHQRSTVPLCEVYEDCGESDFRY